MENAESSYEGAVRRLASLGHGTPQPAYDLAKPRLRSAKGLLAPPSPTAIHAQAQRIKDLEELAELACDENEALKREVDALRSENDDLQRRIRGLEHAIENPRALLGLTPETNHAVSGTLFVEGDDEPFAEIAGHYERRRETSGASGLFATFFMLAAITAAALFASSIAPAPGDSFASLARMETPLGEMLTTSVARALPFHPRYGRDLLPAQPTLLVTDAPVARAPVVVAHPAAPPVVATQPAVVAPKPHKKVVAKAEKKTPKPKHVGKKTSEADPLAGLSL